MKSDFSDDTADGLANAIQTGVTKGLEAALNKNNNNSQNKDSKDSKNGNNNKNATNNNAGSENKTNNSNNNSTPGSSSTPDAKSGSNMAAGDAKSAMTDKALGAAANMAGGSQEAQDLVQSAKAGVDGARLFAGDATAAVDLAKNPIVWKLMLALALLPILLFFVMGSLLLAIVTKIASFFSFLQIDDSGLSYDEMTREEQYEYIADIFSKKVQSEYDKMIDDWISEINTNASSEKVNGWGVALELAGYPNNDIDSVETSTESVIVGSGHDSKTHAKSDYWGKTYAAYIVEFPSGLVDSNGNFLDGDEPYFDSTKSNSSMADGSFNGGIMDMGTFVAGYNVSRCDMPIGSASDDGWFISTFKSYYWDITSDTWWTDIKSKIGIDSYFDYKSELISEDRERTALTYQENIWSDVVTQVDYTIKVDATIAGKGSSISTSIAKNPSLSFTQATNNSLAVTYYNSIANGTKWADVKTISNFWSYLDMTNNVPSQTPKYYNPFTGKFETTNTASNATIAWTSYNNELTGKVDFSYEELTATGAVAKSYTYKSASYVSGTTYYAYTGMYLNATTNTVKTVDLSSYVKAGTSITSSLISTLVYGNTTSGYQTNPTITSYVSHTWDSKYLKESVIPAEEGQKYNVIRTYAKSNGYVEVTEVVNGKVYANFYDAKYTSVTVLERKYSYNYSAATYVEKGITATFKASASNSSNSTKDKTKTSFNKSTYEDETYSYKYNYLKASSDTFNHSKMMENLFENGSYYDGDLSYYSVPSYNDNQGYQVPAELNIPISELYEGVTSLSDDYQSYSHDGEYGILDWPYRGSSALTAYECGALGSSSFCDDTDETNFLKQNKDGTNTACGCGAASLTFDEDTTITGHASTGVARSTVTELKIVENKVLDANGNPVINADGEYEVESYIGIKTVQDKIDEVLEDYQNTLENYDMVQDKSKLTGGSGMYGGFGYNSYYYGLTDLAIFCIELLSSNEGTFGSVNPCDPGYSSSTQNYGSYSLGIFQWNSTRAQSLIKAIYEYDPDETATQWAKATESAANPTNYFLMNNNWNHASSSHTICTHTQSESFRTALSSLLESKAGQYVQNMTAGTEIQGYIDHCVSKGITDPAAIAWCVDIINQYGQGGFNNVFGSVITSALASGGTLDDFYYAYLASGVGTAYKTRRTNTYQEIKGAAARGELPESYDTMSLSGNAAVIPIAESFLGNRYLWGGKTPPLFDCSGLVAYCYEQIGKSVPHGSSNQKNAGVGIATMADALPGDILWFDGHVMLYMGDDKLIHSAGGDITGSVKTLDGAEAYLTRNGPYRIRRIL